MRTTRTVRRLLTTAITAGALFALPAAASAAVTVDLDLASPASPAEAGSTVNYTLDITPTMGDSDAAATIALSIYNGNGNGAAIGMPVVVAAGANADNVTVDGAGIINVDDAFAFADGAVQVTIPVTLPKGYRSDDWSNGFQIKATGAGDGFTGQTATSTSIVVTKGGPSQISVVPTKIASAGESLLNRWVKKDVDAAADILVANTGKGAAHYVVVDLSATGSANELFSPTAPAPATAFTPELVITGGCTVDPLDATKCEIAELAPGASVTITASLKKLTHYGTVSVSGGVDTKADAGTDYPGYYCGSSDYVWNNEGSRCDVLVDRDGFEGSVAVTDGTTAEPHMALGTDKVVAANGEEVVYNGELTNNGPTAIANGKLSFTATSFKSNGSTYGGAYTDTPDVVKSIQVIDIPGATCANRVNNSVVPAKTYLDRYDCTIPSLPVGARLAFVVKVKFATAIRNYAGSVDGSFTSMSYAAPGSVTDPYENNVTVNADKTVDIEVTAKSQAVIGAGHIAPVTVTVKNNGNTKTRSTSINGSIQNLLGEFDNASHGAQCTNVVKKRFVSCSFGELAPGQSKSIDLWVVAGKKLGPLPVSITAGSNNGQAVETNEDNDWVIQSLTIVKANAAPLLGVKLTKFKAAKLAAVLKAGIKTQVTAPGAATIKVDLAVTPKVAKQLGLSKKVGKKNVVIGTKTVKTTKSGKVMVTTKISLKWKKKVAAAKTKFAVLRIVKVTSNEKKSAGATSLTTSSTSFTVAKKKAKK